MNFDPFKNFGKKGEEIKIPEVIRISEGREVLAAKMQEYEKRLTSPGYSPQDKVGIFCRIALIDTLLKEGEVRPGDIRKQLNITEGSSEDKIFEEATKIIIDYIQTGGRKLQGGTGLPQQIQEDFEQ